MTATTPVQHMEHRSSIGKPFELIDKHFAILFTHIKAQKKILNIFHYSPFFPVASFVVQTQHWQSDYDLYVSK